MELLFLNSLSKDGNMAESLEPGVGLKNSELFFNKNKIPIENTIFIDILDSNVIKEYDKSLVEISEYGVRYISADALITKKNNLFIYQKFGDCIPFTVYDTENNTLVFAHLGVVSVINLLHKEIIKKLTTEYSSNVKNLKCYLGPSIKKESYLKEINDNKIVNELGKYLEKKGNNMYLVDMQGFVVDNLLSMGILKENIYVDPSDTAKDQRYFSHYRSKNDPSLKEQRFIYGVMISRGEI